MQNHMWAQRVCSRVENIIIQIIWYSSDQQQQTLWHGLRAYAIFSHAYVSTLGDLSVYRLVPKGLYRVCTEFDSREISQLTQSLTNNGHPSIWWPRSIVLNSGFWVKQHANF